MGKEAVVFILDTYPSMNTTYPAENKSGSTRLSCAKNVMEYMISDLMIQSKTNEVGVVLLKTIETDHHMIPPALRQQQRKRVQTEDDDENNNQVEEEEFGQQDEIDTKELPFPNITELIPCSGGISRPNIQLLRQIGQVQSTAAATTTEEITETIRGDFCDGIIVAADALHQRTMGKKYERRIVLFTDAQHDVIVDVNQILIVIDALRLMQCQLQVIGLDFTTTSKHFEQPQPDPVSSSQAYKKAKVEKDDDDDFFDDVGDKEQGQQQQFSVDDDFGEEINVKQEEEEDEYDDNHSTTSQDNDKNVFSYSTRQDREQLLISLTEKTGGNVLNATSMQQILETTLGKKIVKAVKRKIQFRMGTPGITGLVFDNVQYSLMQKKTAIPRLKKEAVLLDSNGQPKLNGRGEEMTVKVKDEPTYWHVPPAPAPAPATTDNNANNNNNNNTNNPDANNNNNNNNISLEKQQPPEEEDGIELQPSDRTKAVRYGTDIIPIGKLDLDGLKKINSFQNNNNSSNNEDPHLQILGYMDRFKIPQTLLIGPPYAISSDDSIPASLKGSKRKSMEKNNQRTKAALSSLAQALYKLDRVAICTLLKSKGSDPILGGLFPLCPFTKQQQQQRKEHEPDPQPSTAATPPPLLVFLQLPFAGDVKRFSMKPLDDCMAELDDNNNNTANTTGNSTNDKELAKCADDLIQSLLLPDHVLCSEQLPNPVLRSYRKTLVNRALNPHSKTIVAVRKEEGGDDYMALPKDILKSAQANLNEFRTKFPPRIKKIEDDVTTGDATMNTTGGITTFKKKKKKHQLTFRDFL